MSPRASPRARTVAPSRRWGGWTGASGGRCPGVPARGVLGAAGAGNRGGGGGGAAGALHAAAVPVWVAGLDPKTDDAIDNRARARVDGGRGIGRGEPWPAAAVAVDALLG